MNIAELFTQGTRLWSEFWSPIGSPQEQRMAQ